MKKFDYDYQYGYCHYFANVIIKQIRKLLPNKEINYLLVLGEREGLYSEPEDVLIHAYINIGNYILDSEGFHQMDNAEMKRLQWEEYERRMGGSDYETYSSWIEVADEIPGYFFNTFCSVSKVKKDIKEFMSNPQFQSFISELKKNENL